MELHDGRPVTRHEAWFRKRVFDVPEADAAVLEEDRVVAWLVIGVSRDSSYAKRKDDPDAKARTTVIDVDTVAALHGTLREQAIDYLAAAHDSRDLRAELDARPADIDLDRLADYLRAHWGVEPDASTVDTVIALLERLSTQPHPADDAEPEPEPEPEPEVESYLAPRPAEEPPGAWPVTADDDFTAGAEVIGSIYRNVKTHALLDQAFSEADR